MSADEKEDMRPQPCLTRRDGVVCRGTLLPVTEREWRCTEGHTMWGTAQVMRSTPWPADRVRPTGLAWVGHVLASGGLCLVRCPHFTARTQTASSTTPVPLPYEGDKP